MNSKAILSMNAIRRRLEFLSSLVRVELANIDAQSPINPTDYSRVM